MKVVLFDASEVYQFAVRIEENGERLYRKIAKRTTNLQVRDLFLFLADEDVKHRKQFAELLSKLEKPGTSQEGCTKRRANDTNSQRQIGITTLLGWPKERSTTEQQKENVMKMKTSWIGVWMAACAVGLFLASAPIAAAHCDTLSGPVISDAKLALEKGDVTPVLKWVKPEHEQEIKDAFNKALAVKNDPTEAKKAETSFFEVLVRIHRAGEGFAYTGIKDEPVEPIVAMSDKALDSGSADELIGKITAHVTASIRERFNKAAEAKKHVNDSVEAGRAYVAAYVEYMHYVEGIHLAVMGAGGHHEGGAEPAEGEQHHEE